MGPLRCVGMHGPIHSWKRDCPRPAAEHVALRWALNRGRPLLTHGAGDPPPPHTHTHTYKPPPPPPPAARKEDNHAAPHCATFTTRAAPSFLWSCRWRPCRQSPGHCPPSESFSSPRHRRPLLLQPRTWPRPWISSRCRPLPPRRPLCPSFPHAPRPLRHPRQRRCHRHRHRHHRHRCRHRRPGCRSRCRPPGCRLRQPPWPRQPSRPACCLLCPCRYWPPLPLPWLPCGGTHTHHRRASPMRPAARRRGKEPTRYADTHTS
jgi:hypothetical protein